ncbi:PhzF family phenazine biosynthesis protein [Sandaracinobacter sp. RS1-74]|uniref:PhzF family phenazine biosynthesis protein n=1 Tax=Sandaracinobacteroides sayramensis TaxID=2913411 RepID=UPI001EDAD5E6|nr:PhzF family phenazine biosynthesis protein [Sandaracinobacteroides sayramensis]MCG2842351.1 PhzF family phenazine biosynthesis protein [Sandaracinobacteroides sayramensis]
MSRSFEIVDVFTTRPLAGNQLAVVTDARELSAARMQAIAREFNFAETSFLLPPADPANSAHVRIFTPAEEMPFAGHPNVGTAYVVARMGELFGRPVADELRFEEAAGLVALEIERDGDAVTGARCRAPRPLAEGAEVPAAIVAELAGLDPADILEERFAPRFASVGAEFLLAEVSAAALERAAPDAGAFARHNGRIGQTAGLLGLHLHVRDPNDSARLDARMFAPLAGVAEDPATGSAAAALGAFLHKREPGLAGFALTQGRHIGRPSEIMVELRDGAVWIGGPCAAFAHGELAE